MQPPSFLNRKTFGVANYFLIALGLVFFVATIPRGARMAIESNTNKAKDWLPKNYTESTDIAWFRDHFVGEQFVLLSYEGCTYGNHEKLDHLARSLVPGWRSYADLHKDAEAAGVEGPAAEETKPATGKPTSWFKRVITGPSVVEELIAESQLSESEALKRIEGALVGPRGRDDQGDLLPQESRTSSLVVTLTPKATASNKNMRRAVERIAEIAQANCAIPAGVVKTGFGGRVRAWLGQTFLGESPPPDILHMGGPPVDNVAIDIEGERTLVRLAGLSGLVGVLLSYWCFRSVSLTMMVFAVGSIAATMSLALVYYYGVFVEQLLLGMPKARLGTADAVLMSMPAVVYVLGLSGAIHIVNYYKDARHETGRHRAAEAAFMHAWGPCTLAALTTAVGLGTLYISDITPIKKFGMFTAMGVMATLAVLFTLLPVALHRFPISDEELEADRRRTKKERRFSIERILMRVGGFVVQHNVGVCCFWLAMMVFFALGLPRIKTSVQLMKLFDDNAEIRHDYAWLEAHLGNLVPMEIIIPLDPAQLRTGDEGELAETNGERYRLTMLERVRLVQRIRDRVEALPQIGRALSVASFVPDNFWEVYGGGDYAANKQLEKSHDRFLDGDYLQEELDEDGRPTGREIWRVSARVRALDDGRGQEMDYGEFVHELRAIVDPILLAYRQRDEILRQLDEQGKRLSTSRLVILFRGPDGILQPPEKSQEHLLVDLLRESGPKKRIVPLNLAMLGGKELNEKLLARTRDKLEPLACDAAIIVSAGSQDVAAKRLTDGFLPLIDVSGVPEPAKDGSSAAAWVVKADEPHPIAAVYTGVVPLVYKTQRQLLYSLQQSIGWATVLIAFVMICVLRSPFAGLVSMIPNVFPIVVVFGALGWLGIKVDIGIMMTASVALGVAVDDTIHFVWWFRHGIEEGMDRRKATLYAYERCGTAMTQTTLIAGFGLAVFATSTFTPTQQFGYLMITILSAALVGDLLLLPAILSGPVGKIFRARLASAGETGGEHAPTSDELVSTSDDGASPSDEPTPKLRAAPKTVDAATPTAPHHLRDAAKRSARAS